MESTIAKAAIGGATSNVASSLGLGSKEPEMDEAGGIKWYLYNYPPYINVIHFDPENDPISPAARILIKWIHNTFRLVMALFALNVVSTIIIVAAGEEKAVHIFYALLFGIIGSISAAFIFYQGYRGVAANLEKNLQYFKIGEAVGILAAFLLAIISSGNVHGLAGLGSSAGSTLTFFAVVESLGWFGASALIGFSLWKVHTGGHTAAYVHTSQNSVDERELTLSV